MARTCLPHAASGDVGAVHHDTSLDARPLVDRIVVFLWSASRQWQPSAEIPIAPATERRRQFLSKPVEPSIPDPRAFDTAFRRDLGW
jgi:hypothetical protein